MAADPLVGCVVIGDNTCLLFRVNKRVATTSVVARSFVVWSLFASVCLLSRFGQRLARVNPVCGTPRYRWNIWIPAHPFARGTADPVGKSPELFDNEKLNRGRIVVAVDRGRSPDKKPVCPDRPPTHHPLSSAGCCLARCAWHPLNSCIMLAILLASW